MTTKDKVEERIRELVPELSCGCSNGHLFLGYGGENNDEPEWGICPNCVINGVYNPSYGEIHLEHILLAIGKQNKIKPNLELFSIQLSFGYEDNVLYDLSKPFSDQSEELYLFLLDILK